MRIYIDQPITALNAGRERVSYDLLPATDLERTSSDALSPLSTGQIPIPPLLERLLESADYTYFLEHFLNPEDCRPLNEDSQTIGRGSYELMIVDNPFRHEARRCTEPWFAITGTRERIGMPLTCWAEYIARGSVELLHD